MEEYHNACSALQDKFKEFPISYITKYDKADKKQTDKALASARAVAEAARKVAQAAENIFQPLKRASPDLSQDPALQKKSEAERLRFATQRAATEAANLALQKEVAAVREQLKQDRAEIDRLQKERDGLQKERDDWQKRADALQAEDFRRVAKRLLSITQTKNAVDKYKTMKKYATQIQSLARTRQAVQKLDKAKKAKKAATQIQSLARTRKAVQNLDKAKDVVTQIQSLARTRKAVQNLDKAKKAATVIASEARKRQAQKLLKKMQHPLGGQFFDPKDLNVITHSELEKVRQQLDLDEIPVEIQQLAKDHKGKAKQLPQLGLDMIFQSLATDSGEISVSDLEGLLGFSLTEEHRQALGIAGGKFISINVLKKTLSFPFS